MNSNKPALPPIPDINSVPESAMKYVTPFWDYILACIAQREWEHARMVEISKKGNSVITEARQKNARRVGALYGGRPKGKEYIVLSSTGSSGLCENYKAHGIADVRKRVYSVGENAHASGEPYAIVVQKVPPKGGKPYEVFAYTNSPDEKCECDDATMKKWGVYKVDKTDSRE